jgi:hypothetical protein
MRGAGDPRDGEQPPATGTGDSRPASAVAPGSAPRARGRGSADAPGADRPPPIPRGPWPWWLRSHSLTLSISGTSRLQLAISAWAWPALGGSRRRAPLKSSVEKVVTGPGTGLPTFCSVAPCAGIPTGSDQFVTSGSLPPDVHIRPENYKVVHPHGSQRGSQPKPPRAHRP